jgi:hypothetical protein
MQENTTSLPAGRAMAVPAPKSLLGYTAAEASMILGKHINTIYAWMRHGGPLAAARQIGSTFYIPRRALLALLDLDEGAPTPTGGEAA